MTYDWTVRVSDPTVLSTRAFFAPLPAGTQAVLDARAPGTATIEGTGTVHCAPGQACIQIAILFRTTVVVR